MLKIQNSNITLSNLVLYISAKFGGCLTKKTVEIYALVV